jgi:FkbM family methyltransferase
MSDTPYTREEREARERFALYASRFTRYLAVERGGALFFVSTRSSYGRRLFANRPWKDARQLERVDRAVRRAGIELRRTTFVDVGAHIGTSAIEALRNHGFETVVAFEPEAENFRILRTNVRMNGLEERVRAYNVAVADSVGTRLFNVRGGPGAATHSLVKEGGTGVPVSVTTLDRLVDEGTLDRLEVGLLWIDVEGAEIEVLEGARSLLGRAVPFVIEFAPDRFRDSDRIAVLNALVSPSYTHFFNLKPRRPLDRTFEPLDTIGEVLSRHTKKTDLLFVRLR